MPNLALKVATMQNPLYAGTYTLLGRESTSPKEWVSCFARCYPNQRNDNGWALPIIVRM